MTGAAWAAVTEFRPLLKALWKVGQWKSRAAERATHPSGAGVHLASVVQQKPGGHWWNWGEVHRTQLRKPRGGITHSSVPSPRLVPSPPICSILSCVPALVWLGRCVPLGLQPGACGSRRVGMLDTQADRCPDGLAQARVWKLTRIRQCRQTHSMIPPWAPRSLRDSSSAAVWTFGSDLAGK